MKLVFFEIVIANILDDTTRSVIAVCDESETDVLCYINDIAHHYVNLSDYSEESIQRITRIVPENISANDKMYDAVNAVLANKQPTQ